MVEELETVNLEEEGEIAADYLEGFLDIIDVDGDIELDVQRDRASVEIVGNAPDLQHLVGSDGIVVDALQDLTRLAVQVKTGVRSRLMLEVAEYRKQRVAALTDQAAAAISKVKNLGRPEDLEPMNAFERKVVHDYVASLGLTSESHGTDPYRYVTISVSE
jgi:spoIIIJ-associated protein